MKRDLFEKISKKVSKMKVEDKIGIVLEYKSFNKDEPSTYLGILTSMDNEFIDLESYRSVYKKDEYRMEWTSCHFHCSGISSIKIISLKNLFEMLIDKQKTFGASLGEIKIVVESATQEINKSFEKLFDMGGWLNKFKLND